MADYADVSEVDEIEKIYADFPPIDAIVNMCIALGIKRNYERTRNNRDDAWAYYHELKALFDEQHRKTA